MPPKSMGLIRWRQHSYTEVANHLRGKALLALLTVGPTVLAHGGSVFFSVAFAPFGLSPATSSQPRWLASDDFCLG